MPPPPVDQALRVPAPAAEPYPYYHSRGEGGKKRKAEAAAKAAEAKKAPAGAPAAAAAAPAAPSAPSVFKPPVDESAAKAAWLAKQGTKGQWGRAAAVAAAVTGNVVASAPAAAPHGGKGFGGGEATRDPTPTAYDPNDPKGKQQAIHKAESFAEYLAKRA